jgi:hypothetical protein
MVVLGCVLRKQRLSSRLTCWRPVDVGTQHVRAQYIGAPFEWPLKLEPLIWRPLCLHPVHVGARHVGAWYISAS